MRHHDKIVALTAKPVRSMPPMNATSRRISHFARAPSCDLMIPKTENPP